MTAQTPKSIVPLLLAVLLAIVLAACAPQPTPAAAPLPTAPSSEPAGQPTVVSHGGQVQDYASLVDALREHGATVEPGGELEQPFFPVKGQAIKVDGQDVQVFEFADAPAAEAVAATIGSTGDQVGTSMVTWVEAPHFYRAGRVVVLYVGSDPSTLEALASVLGPQFAGR